MGESGGGFYCVLMSTTLLVYLVTMIASTKQPKNSVWTLISLAGQQLTCHGQWKCHQNFSTFSQFKQVSFCPPTRNEIRVSVHTTHLGEFKFRHFVLAIDLLSQKKSKIKRTESHQKMNSIYQFSDDNSLSSYSPGEFPSQSRQPSLSPTTQPWPLSSL